MNNTDNTVFLKDILTRIAKIERYLQGYNFEKFQNNELVTDALVRNVEIIGEAANNVNARFSLKNAANRVAKNY